MKDSHPSRETSGFAVVGRVCAVLLPCCVVAALYWVGGVGAASGARGVDALFEGIRRGDVAAVERALALGTPVEAKLDGSDLTPLIAAAMTGRRQTVECLLAHGADVRAAAGVFGTPVGAAAAFGSPELVRLLLERGGDANRPNAYGYTPLMAAACSGDQARVELLIHAGAAVNARDDCGNTALLIAAANGYAPAVSRLLAAGADVHAHDRYGRNPADVAAAEGHPQIANLCRVAALE